MFPSSEAVAPRPVAKPLLAMAAALTVAWFAIAAVTIAPSGSQRTTTGYGVDEVPQTVQLAQR